MLEEADFWRAHLVEAVAEYDDHLMEKFFEDPNSISEDEIHLKQYVKLLSGPEHYTNALRLCI